MGRLGRVQRKRCKALVERKPVALFGNQPPQPTGRRSGLAQRRQIVIRLHEGFLSNILADLVVTHSGEGDRAGEVLIALNEQAKGFEVPR